MAEEPQPEVISDKLLLDAAWERQQKKVCKRDFEPPLATLWCIHSAMLASETPRVAYGRRMTVALLPY